MPIFMFCCANQFLTNYFYPNTGYYWRVFRGPYGAYVRFISSSFAENWRSFTKIISCVRIQPDWCPVAGFLSIFTVFSTEGWICPRQSPPYFCNFDESDIRKLFFHEICYTHKTATLDTSDNLTRSYRDEFQQRRVLEAVVLVCNLGDLFQQVLHVVLSLQSLKAQFQLLLLCQLTSLCRRHLSLDWQPVSFIWQLNRGHV